MKKGLGFGGVAHGAEATIGVGVSRDEGLAQDLGSGDGEIGSPQSVPRKEPGGGLGMHHGGKEATFITFCQPALHLPRRRCCCGPA